METSTVVQVEETYFRPEEAARYLKIGRSAIFALLREGEIPSVALGYRTRIIRRVDLDAYVARKLAEAAEA